MNISSIVPSSNTATWHDKFWENGPNTHQLGWYLNHLASKWGIHTIVLNRYFPYWKLDDNSSRLIIRYAVVIVIRILASLFLEPAALMRRDLLFLLTPSLWCFTTKTVVLWNLNSSTLFRTLSHYSWLFWPLTIIAVFRRFAILSPSANLLCATIFGIIFEPIYCNTNNK